MPDFTPQITSEVVATCRANGEEAAIAFGRALDGEFSVAVDETSILSGESLPDTWNVPGLVMTFHVGDAAALLLFPETGGMLPAWCTEPDDTGRSKLATLAQELGYLLLPEAFTPEATAAARVKNLAEAFQRAEPAGDVSHLPLRLTSGEKSGQASLVWPVQALAKTLDEPLAEESEVEPASAVPTGVDKSTSTQEHFDAQRNTANQAAILPGQAKSAIQYADIEDGIRQLPSYAKSLLRVRIPVTVTLASAKHPVSQILALGPGSIIQFNKTCEDNLTLEVRDQAIALGEAVKVGDKFGLWITSMTMPDERFWVVQGQRGGVRVK